MPAERSGPSDEELSRQRKEASDKKREEEAAIERLREAKFKAQQAEAMSLMKGISPAGAELKGVGEPSSRLKGVDDTASLKLSAARNVDPAQLKAWQQLHCAAFIMRNALESVVGNGGYAELRYLSREATSAMDGAALTVQCKPAPPFPVIADKTPNLELLRQRQKQLIERAQSVGSRMEEREAALSDAARKALKEVRASAPAHGAERRTETEEERLRRIQLALNRINEAPIDGKTIAAIQQQEKDRLELGRMLLAEEELEKGNVDASINLTEEPARRRQVDVPPPSTRPKP